MSEALPSYGPEPSVPPPIQIAPIPGADPDAAEAIESGAEALGALDSYKFNTDVVGRTLGTLEPSPVDVSLRGTLTRSNGLAVDALMATRLRETNGSGAAVTSTSHLVLGDGYMWDFDRLSGALEPTPAGGQDSSLSPLLPDGLVSRVVIPFASAYQRVGVQQRDGIETVHYAASKEGAAAYALALRFDGELAADLWIGSGDGHIAAVRIAGSQSDADQVLIEFSVTNANDATNVVELPATPVPDPVRLPPGGPAVDMQLEYRAMPSDGWTATPGDMQAMSVTLRKRLDVSARPVKVTVIEPDRLVVTVCNTTRPEDDREVIEAIGALMVVPLPAADYGSTSKAGRLELPAVGSAIDPAQKPIAPPARVGLASAHVDPLTGRRGVAFYLGNRAAEDLRTYAAAHMGEYVAVVLDGEVLAIIPIDERVARGTIAFTGDYTEAESRRLARSLYDEPLPFPLELVHEVLVPVSGSPP